MSPGLTTSTRRTAKRVARTASRKRAAAPADARGSWSDLLGQYDDEVQHIAKRLRTLVRGELPRAEEKVWTRGWRMALYRDGTDICGIGPMKQGYVNFYFTRGADLPDPEGLLEGSGTSIRHVKVRPGTIPAAALKRLVRAGKILATRPARRRTAKKK